MNHGKIFPCILTVSVFLLSFLCNSVGNALGWPAIGLLADDDHQMTLIYERGEIHCVLHHHEFDSEEHHMPGYVPSSGYHHDQDHDHKVRVSSPEHYFRTVKKLVNSFKKFAPACIYFQELNASKEMLRFYLFKFSHAELWGVFFKTVVLRI